MKTSKLPLLDKIDTLILSAGHGGNDSGTVNGKYKEAVQIIQIVDTVAENLRAEGIKVVIVPHALDSGRAYVNERYKKPLDAWAVELHRDGFKGIKEPSASKRCGVYYGTSPDSKKIGDHIKSEFIKCGAHGTSWSRPDTKVRFKRLEWIRQVNTLSHLLELGFIQGKNDQNHLAWLAMLATQVIYEAFTGKQYTGKTKPKQPKNQIAVKWKKDNFYRVFSPEGKQLYAGSDIINNLDVANAEVKKLIKLNETGLKDLEGRNKKITELTNKIKDIKASQNDPDQAERDCKCKHGVVIPERKYRGIFKALINIFKKNEK